MNTALIARAIERRRMPPGRSGQLLPPAGRPGPGRLAGQEPVEIVGQVAGGRIAPCRVLRQALQDDRLQRDGQVFPRAARRERHHPR